MPWPLTDILVDGLRPKKALEEKEKPRKRHEKAEKERKQFDSWTSVAA